MPFVHSIHTSTGEDAGESTAVFGRGKYEAIFNRNVGYSVTAVHIHITSEYINKIPLALRTV